jgi:hypothetical protein
MLIEGDLAVFGVGVAGGVANELLRWYGLRDNPNLPAYAKSVFYWAISLAMILLGGGLAWLQLGNSAEGLIAFQIGLAAPMVLTNLAKVAPSQKGAMGQAPASIGDFLKG